ncbi:MAG: hypothetical protein ACK47B_07975 [Armatimonadota bacterium]
MRRLLSVLGLSSLLLGTAPAAAHEPLWGETPITFGFGVIHPEVKLMYFDAGTTRRGGERMRMFEQEYMVDYGISPRLNLRLEVPYHNSLHQTRLRGRLRSTFVSGLGDITLRAKSRISAKQEVGYNMQQSVFFGVKLPTGDDTHPDPGGGRLEPHSQTGTGNPGLLLGYAWDLERLDDTTWASLVWTRDLGGGFRMGDMLAFDAAYGYWTRPQREAADLGLNTALGIHAEWHSDDPLGGGRDADNRHGLLGLHLTQMVIRGSHQFRVGVMVPLARTGEAAHSDFPYELRVAFETFF